jgi:two-component system, LytTR family, response regulator
MRKYRTLIVDDEPSAREGTRQLLVQDPEIDVIGECANGVDAAAAIIDDGPDIVILDIQMPDLDGFGCLALFDPASRPEVVFLTAYEEYARKAFDVDAADYVLKPFSDARLREAVARAKQRRRVRTQEARPVTRFVVRHGTVTHVVHVSDIDYIEGADYYARIHAGGASYLIRQTLAQLLTQLDPGKFVRTHRSVIVNVDRIRQLLPRVELAIVLSSGKRLPLSRRLRPKVEAFLRNGTSPRIT